MSHLAGYFISPFQDSLPTSELIGYIKKGCYWPYDQVTNVKRTDTVIVKCAI